MTHCVRLGKKFVGRTWYCKLRAATKNRQNWNKKRSCVDWRPNYFGLIRPYYFC